MTHMICTIHEIHSIASNSQNSQSCSVDTPHIDTSKPTISRAKTVDAYGEACAQGRIYAAMLAETLQANPDMVGAGMLMDIVKSMNLADPSERKGRIVGFFEFIERQLLAGHNPRNVADRMNQSYADIAARAAEAACH